MLATTVSKIAATIGAVGLIAASVVVGAAPASAASSITVTVGGDAASAACTNPATTTVSASPTLREAVCVANNRTEVVSISIVGVPSITLGSEGPLLVGTHAGANISITSDIGTTIAGNGSSRVMTIDPEPVGGVTASLTNLTITGGVDNEFGGAGIIAGSGSAATADSLTINNSTISNNRANTTGTTMNNPGGGLQFIGGSLSVSNTTFSGNASGTSAGGGLAYQASGVSGESLSIDNTRIVLNSAIAVGLGATNGGAGIVVDDLGTTPMSITRSTISGNTLVYAPGQPDVRGGSGLWLRGGTLALSQSTITDNSRTVDTAGNPTGVDGTSILVESGATLTARYNRLFETTPGTILAARSGSTVDAKLNSWGCTGVGVSPCGLVTAPDALTTPYLRLGVTAAPSTLASGRTTSSLVASLVASDASTLDASKLTAFTALPVLWSTPTPSPATLSAASSLLGGTVTYDRKGTSGRGSATATFEGGATVVPLTLNTIPTITSAATATFQLGSSNRFSFAGASFPAATYTEAGALPSGVTLSPSGVLAGIPTTNGRYPITVTAANTEGTVNQSFVLLVNSPPAFTSAPATTYRVGTSKAFTITSDAYPTLPTISLTGALPAGLIFVVHADGTASLDGAPDAGSGGVYSLTFTAAVSGSPSATQTFTLTVTAAPVVTTAPRSQTVNAGNAVSFTAAASGYPVPTIQWQTATSTGSFADVTGATSATLTVTPAQADNGRRYRAVFTNSVSSTTSAEATLTVGTAPTISSLPSVTFVADGTQQSFTVTTSGVPDATIATTGTVPSWLTLAPGTGGTATLSGIPPLGSGGVFSFGITATNGYDPTARQSFALTVNEAPRLAATGAVTVVEGTSGSYLIESTAGYPAPTTVSFTGTLPAGLRFTDNGNGTATIDRTPGAGSAGVYPLTVSASNSVGSTSTQTLTITVNRTAAVTAEPTARTVVAGTSVTFTAAASGAPAPTVLWEKSTNGTSFAAIAGATANDLTFVAVQGDSGSSYRAVFTGQGVATSTAALLTVGTPAAITSGTTANFGVRGTTQSFAITTTGTPAPLVTLVSGGTAWLSLVTTSPGVQSLVATPPAGAGGVYSVALSASNGFGTPATQTISVTVIEPTTISSGADAVFTVGIPASFTVSTTGYPKAAAITTAGTFPAGISFTDNGDGTGEIHGTPDAGTGGVSTRTFSATNGVGGAATQTFSLQINEPTGFTSAASAVFLSGTAGSFDVTTGGGYPAATGVTITGALPAGLRFTDNGATATIAGTPTGGGENTSVTLTTTNGVGDPVTQQLAISVRATPAVTTQPESANVSAGTPVTFVAAASGFPAPTVRWQVSTGAAFTDIADATSSSLLVTATQPDSANRYRAVFTNVAGEVATDSATLTVGTPAVISSSPTIAVTAGGGEQRSAVTTTGVPAATITLTDAPAWLTLVDAGDGTATLVATPPSTALGSFSATVSATNGYGDAATQTMQIVASRASAITSPDETDFSVGDSGSFTITTDGSPTATALTLAGDLPDGLAFVQEADGTATISGTAAVDTGGVWRVTVTAGNGLGTAATQTLVITVAEPIGIRGVDTTSLTRGVTASVTVTTRGYPAATSVGYTGTLPEGLTFTDNGDGTATVSGRPLASPGTSSVAFTAGRGGTTSPPTSLAFEIVPAVAVDLPSSMPLAVDRLGMVSTGAPGDVIGVRGAGFAPFAPIEIGIYSSPTLLGTVVADVNGAFATTVTIPAGLTGSHTVVAGGIADTGNARFAASGIELSVAAVSGTGSLAATGQDGAPWLLAGLALLLALAGVRLTRRSRALKAR